MGTSLATGNLDKGAIPVVRIHIFLQTPPICSQPVAAASVVVTRTSEGLARWVYRRTRVGYRDRCITISAGIADPAIALTDSLNWSVWECLRAFQRIPATASSSPVVPTARPRPGTAIARGLLLGGHNCSIV